MNDDDDFGDFEGPVACGDGATDAEHGVTDMDRDALHAPSRDGAAAESMKPLKDGDPPTLECWVGVEMGTLQVNGHANMGAGQGFPSSGGFMVMAGATDHDDPFAGLSESEEGHQHHAVDAEGRPVASPLSPPTSQQSAKELADSVCNGVGVVASTHTAPPLLATPRDSVTSSSASQHPPSMQLEGRVGTMEVTPLASPPTDSYLSTHAPEVVDGVDHGPSMALAPHEQEASEGLDALGGTSFAAQGARVMVDIEGHLSPQSPRVGSPTLVVAGVDVSSLHPPTSTPAAPTPEAGVHISEAESGGTVGVEDSAAISTGGMERGASPRPLSPPAPVEESTGGAPLGLSSVMEEGYKPSSRGSPTTHGEGMLEGVDLLQHDDHALQPRLTGSSAQEENALTQSTFADNDTGTSRALFDNQLGSYGTVAEGHTDAPRQHTDEPVMTMELALGEQPLSLGEGEEEEEVVFVDSEIKGPQQQGLDSAPVAESVDADHGGEGSFGGFSAAAHMIGSPIGLADAADPPLLAHGAVENHSEPVAASVSQEGKSAVAGDAEMGGGGSMTELPVAPTVCSPGARAPPGRAHGDIAEPVAALSSRATETSAAAETEDNDFVNGPDPTKESLTAQAARSLGVAVSPRQMMDEGGEFGERSAGDQRTESSVKHVYAPLSPPVGGHGDEGDIVPFGGVVANGETEGTAAAAVEGRSPETPVDDRQLEEETATSASIDTCAPAALHEQQTMSTTAVGVQEVGSTQVRGQQGTAVGEGARAVDDDEGDDDDFGDFTEARFETQWNSAAPSEPSPLAASAPVAPPSSSAEITDVAQPTPRFADDEDDFGDFEDVSPLPSSYAAVDSQQQQQEHPAHVQVGAQEVANAARRFFDRGYGSVDPGLIRPLALDVRISTFDGNLDKSLPLCRYFEPRATAWSTSVLTQELMRTVRTDAAHTCVCEDTDDGGVADEVISIAWALSSPAPTRMTPTPSEESISYNNNSSQPVPVALNRARSMTSQTGRKSPNPLAQRPSLARTASGSKISQTNSSPPHDTATHSTTKGRPAYTTTSSSGIDGLSDLDFDLLGGGSVYSAVAPASTRSAADPPPGTGDLLSRTLLDMGLEISKPASTGSTSTFPSFTAGFSDGSGSGQSGTTSTTTLEFSSNTPQLHADEVPSSVKPLSAEAKNIVDMFPELAYMLKELPALPHHQAK